MIDVMLCFMIRVWLKRRYFAVSRSPLRRCLVAQGYPREHFGMTQDFRGRVVRRIYLARMDRMLHKVQFDVRSGVEPSTAATPTGDMIHHT